MPMEVTLFVRDIDSANWGKAYAEFDDGKPKAEWKTNELLIVRSLAHFTGSTHIAKDGTRMHVDGHGLILCYKSEPFQATPTAPVASYLFPVVLEFQVTGLRRQNYLITVSDDCRSE